LISEDPACYTGGSSNLDKITTSLIKKFNEDYPDFYLIENSATTLDGISARRLIFTDTNNGITMKSMQVIAIKNNRLYFIDYVGTPNNYSNYESIAKHMIDSFKFI
jgi:hypothetical protein